MEGVGRGGGVILEREGKESVVREGDGGNKEVTYKREQVLAREDIINDARTSTMWPTREKARIWETWVPVKNQQLLRFP
jgi:hypothetical protein